MAKHVKHYKYPKTLHAKNCEHLDTPKTFLWFPKDSHPSRGADVCQKIFKKMPKPVHRPKIPSLCLDLNSARQAHYSAAHTPASEKKFTASLLVRQPFLLAVYPQLLNTTLGS
jgi:hypothetical protein